MHDAEDFETLINWEIAEGDLLGYYLWLRELDRLFRQLN